MGAVQVIFDSQFQLFFMYEDIEHYKVDFTAYWFSVLLSIKCCKSGTFLFEASKIAQKLSFMISFMLIHPTPTQNAKRNTINQVTFVPVDWNDISLMNKNVRNKLFEH